MILLLPGARGIGPHEHVGEVPLAVAAQDRADVVMHVVPEEAVQLAVEDLAHLEDVVGPGDAVMLRGVGILEQAAVLDRARAESAAPI